MMVPMMHREILAFEGNNYFIHSHYLETSSCPEHVGLLVCVHTLRLCLNAVSVLTLVKILPVYSVLTCVKSFCNVNVNRGTT